MDEYIKRTDLEDWLCRICDDVETDSEYVMSRVDEIPIAEVREDIPAKWVEHNIYTSTGNVDMLQSARCSKCEKYHTTPYAYYFDHYNFCPNCGARMTSRRDEENTKSAT